MEEDQHSEEELSQNEDEEQSRYLTEEQKWTIIISYKHFELSQAAICEKFQFYKSTVSKIIKKYQDQGNVENNFSNAGRPSLQSTTNITRYVTEIVKDQKVAFSSTIKQDLAEKYKISVSRSTICKLLKDKGFNYGRVNLIHKLTTQQKENRLTFCRKMFRKGFSNIIFSDECFFQVRNNNLCVWHSDDHPKNYSQQQKQYKDQYLHVWAGIGRRGKTELHFHNKKVGSDEYVNCLEQTFIPFVEEQFDSDEEVFLWQDGAPSHTSKKSLSWIENQNIELIQMPSWSPDTNPIEMIWNSMKQQFNKHNLLELCNSEQNNENLKNVLIEIWNTIDQNVINQTISHTKKCMKQIIQNKGDYLKQYL